MAEPSVTPTSRLDLGAAALVGAFGGWLIVRTAERLTGEAPSLTWLGVGCLAGLLIAVVVLCLRVRREGQNAFVPGDPRPALVRLALAKAALLGGVALAAGYLVFAFLFVDHLDAPLARQRVIHGLLSAILAGGIAGCGGWLERTCRGRWDDGDDDDEGGAPHSE